MALLQRSFSMSVTIWKEFLSEAYMGLFGRFRKTNDELEALVISVENNASNNYNENEQGG